MVTQRLIYPSLGEICSAVTIPQHVFTDSVLKNSKVELYPGRGTPRPYTGGFTITFCLTGAGKKQAVRVFQKEVPNIQERYRIISQFLAKAKSPFFVDFNFQNKGILINSNWYPIVVMEWQDGDRMDKYIERHLRNSLKLKHLNQQLHLCSLDLEQLGMAHGDLQHGNIIMVEEALKLIDYDGAYVPTMSYSASNELGLPDYQHPGREAKHFNATIDRFPFIVMHLSLEALQVKPQLWDQYNDGENLIFKRDDFIKPALSPLIKELQQIPSLRTQVDQFIQLCQLRSPKQIISLNQFLKGKVLFQKIDMITRTRSTETMFESSPAIYDAKNAMALLQQEGNQVRVIGRVEDVYIWKDKKGNDMAYVNFGDYKQGCFQIIIFKEGLDALKINQKITDPKTLKGKSVSLIGLVQIYKGSPQMILDKHGKLNVLLRNTSFSPSNKTIRQLSSDKQAALNKILQLTNQNPQNKKISKMPNQLKSLSASEFVTKLDKKLNNQTSTPAKSNQSKLNSTSSAAYSNTIKAITPSATKTNAKQGNRKKVPTQASEKKGEKKFIVPVAVKRFCRWFFLEE